MRRVTVAILGAVAMITIVNAQTQNATPDLNSVLDRAPGIHYGPLLIQAELDVSYFDNTNPSYAPHDPKNQSGIRAEPLLNLYLTGNGWDAYVNGWLARDWYFGNNTTSDSVARDHYGESAGFDIGSPDRTHFSLSEFYEVLNGDNYVGASSPLGTYNASFGDRHSFSVAALLGTPLGERTGMNVGAKYSDLWYASQALYGWQDEGATLGFTRKISDKSNVLLDFGADNQTSDGSSGDSQVYRALLGFETKPTVKTSIRAEVGYMGYEFDSGSKSAYSPTYALSGNWQISQRLMANFSGAATYQPSESDRNNYTLVDTLSAGFSFQATRRLTTSVNTFYRREHYAEADALAGERRIDNEIGLGGGASYRLCPHTSVFVDAEYSKDQSTIDEWSYNRLFVETGLKINF